MPNQYNDLFEGVINGLQSVGGGLIKHKIQSDAYDLFNQSQQSLMNYVNGVNNPPQNQTNDSFTQPKVNANPIVNNGQAGVNLNIPLGDNASDESKYQRPYNNQNGSNPQRDLFDFINTKGQLGQFGDVGKPYVATLNELYGMVTPQPKDYEYKDVNGEIVRIDKKTGKTEKVYGNPKVNNQYDMTKPYLSEKDGKYYMQYPYVDKSTGKTALSEPMEINKELYDDYKGDKWLTAQQKSDIIEDRQRNIMQFKLDLGGMFGNGKKKGSGDGRTVLEKADYQSAKNLADDLRNYKNLDSESQDKVNKKLALIASNTGLSVEDVKSMINNIGNMTEKQAKNYFLTYNRNLLQEKKEIEDAYNKIIKKGYQGQDLINALLSAFGQLKGQLSSQTYSALKNKLKTEYGVTLN